MYENSIEKTAEEKEEFIKHVNTTLRYLKALMLIGIGLYELYSHLH